MIGSGKDGHLDLASLLVHHSYQALNRHAKFLTRAHDKSWCEFFSRPDPDSNSRAYARFRMKLPSREDRTVAFGLASVRSWHCGRPNWLRSAHATVFAAKRGAAIELKIARKTPIDRNTLVDWLPGCFRQ
jgi:hypothetical protein